MAGDATERERLIKRLPPSGTRVRGRVLGWTEAQANNLEEFPDPALPTYEGIPEWVEGPLEVRRVRAPWGDVDTVSVKWADTNVDVEPASIKRIGR